MTRILAEQIAARDWLLEHGDAHADPDRARLWLADWVGKELLQNLQQFETAGEMAK